MLSSIRWEMNKVFFSSLLAFRAAWALFFAYSCRILCHVFLFFKGPASACSFVSVETGTEGLGNLYTAYQTADNTSDNRHHPVRPSSENGILKDGFYFLPKCTDSRNWKFAPTYSSLIATNLELHILLARFPLLSKSTKADYLSA